MYEEHPVLFSPKEKDVLWKYMSLPKFLNLLNGHLYFNRIDCFEDVFESTYPKYNELYRETLYRELYNGEYIPTKETYDNIVEYAKKSMFVSCFHKNIYESAFMWKLYGGDNGVAIVTNVERLKMSLKNEKRKIYISDVKYIDYENEFMPESNTFYLGIHKRKSFEHEKEVRCIYSKNAEEMCKEETGILVSVDLKNLIEKVYISPYAPEYMKKDVEKILANVNLEAEVIYSPLYTIK